MPTNSLRRWDPRNEDFVSPDVQFFKIEEDTLLILGSDGLTDNDLLETHYLTHVEPLLSAEMPLEPGVKALIELGNQYNGHDNITAIAVRASGRRSVNPRAPKAGVLACSAPVERPTPSRVGL